MRRPKPFPLPWLVPIALSIQTTTALAGTPPTPSDRIPAGLIELHQGLYGRAEEIFRQAARASPGDPEPLLFVAFSRWWRIVLEDRGRGRSGDLFDTAIDETLTAGERRIESRPDDADALAALGAAHILRSHVEAMRHGYLHAAQDARRGKRFLEASLDRDPGMIEALFALGAFNYFADKVPALVKGLRVLLFLPGGDADRGLEQLKSVAASPAHFRTDARLLLALICGSREEHCYAQALTHLRKALEENPESPLILGSIGEVQMRLGEHDQAAGTLEEALRAASGDDPDRARQRRSLRLALAQALIAGWRLEKAANILRDADGDPGPMTPANLKDYARATRELAIKRGEAPLDSWEEGPPAPPRAGAPASPGRGADPSGDARLVELLKVQEDGRTVDALALLDRMVHDRPASAMTRFIRGRLLALGGRDAEAEMEFEAIDDLEPHRPPWMDGWIEIDRGIIAARRADPRAARAHFRRASETRGFRSSDRAVMELHRNEPGNPRCAP